MEACEYVGHPFYQGVNAILITFLWGVDLSPVGLYWELLIGCSLPPLTKRLASDHKYSNERLHPLYIVRESKIYVRILSMYTAASILNIPTSG